MVTAFAEWERLELAPARGRCLTWGVDGYATESIS